jgi:hypothetical protein
MKMLTDWLKREQGCLKMTTWSARKKQKPSPEGTTQQNGKNNTQNTTSMMGITNCLEETILSYFAFGRVTTE